MAKENGHFKYKDKMSEIVRHFKIESWFNNILEI
jgi:hypothetical protein